MEKKFAVWSYSMQQFLQPSSQNECVNVVVSFSYCVDIGSKGLFSQYGNVVAIVSIIVFQVCLKLLALTTVKIFQL